MVQFTHRQHAVLSMILDGVPSKNIAKRLGVSLRTIEATRQQIHELTGTDSVARLVRWEVAQRIGYDPLGTPEYPPYCGFAQRKNA